MVGVRLDLAEVRHDFEERQAKADLMLSHATPGIAPLDDPRVLNGRQRVAGDVDEAPAPECEVVGHGSFCIPPPGDDLDTCM
jgi:hypothetical protein